MIRKLKAFAKEKSSGLEYNIAHGTKIDVWCRIIRENNKQITKQPK